MVHYSNFLLQVDFFHLQCELKKKIFTELLFQKFWAVEFIAFLFRLFPFSLEWVQLIYIPDLITATVDTE